MNATTEPLPSRQATLWAAGDYARIGTLLQPVGEALCDAVDVHAGERVLDIAAGNGNAALAAARCGADVLATDLVPALLARAAARAEADGLPLRTQTADAERLPFAEATFDVVLSTFGVMFASDQPAAARELRRVCRPGGRIGLTCWTPQGFLGDLFRTLRRHVPAPAGTASPMRWGDERTVRELLGCGHSVDVRTARRVFTFRFGSAAQMVDRFRAWYGPLKLAFESLAEHDAAQLEGDLTRLCEQQNRATDGTLAVPAEYLELVARRR
ncbi:MAG: class I SAM-dependent methyltransferase [Planctomycetes bacterium]|nr:class I SAM-dependent methyltransferase [Planctomycetota bacterium]